MPRPIWEEVIDFKSEPADQCYVTAVKNTSIYDGDNDHRRLLYLMYFFWN